VTAEIMKVYLIVALFLGALVVAHSLEEEEQVELPEQGKFKQSSRILLSFSLEHYCSE
jgi:hypothetical protein